MRTILLVLLLAFNSIGQTKQLTGVILDSMTNEPVAYAKVILFRQNIIISGASTDSDGIYVLKPNKYSIDSLSMEIRQVGCYDTRVIPRIYLIHDSLVITYKLSPFDCDKIVEKECKYLSDSCDIYEVKYMWDYPRRVKRKYRKQQLPPQEKSYMYLPSDFYGSGCCSKKWYCDTHKYRY